MIALVTAANRAIAEVIADHLGLFDRVLASDGVVNLKGSAKAKVLNSEFGSNFTYIGSDYADLAAWAVADTAVVANAPRSLVERVRRISNMVTRISPRWPAMVDTLQGSKTSSVVEKPAVIRADYYG